MICYDGYMQLTGSLMPIFAVFTGLLALWTSLFLAGVSSVREKIKTQLRLSWWVRIAAVIQYAFPVVVYINEK